MNSVFPPYCGMKINFSFQYDIRAPLRPFGGLFDLSFSILGWICRPCSPRLQRQVICCFNLSIVLFACLLWSWPTMVNRIFLMVCRSLEHIPLAHPLLPHFRAAFLLNPCQSKLDLFQRSYLHHPGNLCLGLFSFLDSLPHLPRLLEYHNEISLSHSYSHSLFVTIRLSTLNFLISESQVVNLIESQGCLGFIDGTISPPSPTVTYFCRIPPINLFLTLSITSGEGQTN